MDHSVVAIVARGGKEAKVLLDSIEFVEPSEVQALWLRAWREWSGGR